MFEGAVESSGAVESGLDRVRHDAWRAVDTKLRALAKKRSAMDAEEARWLVAARKTEVHRHLGYGSFGSTCRGLVGTRRVRRGNGRGWQRRWRICRR